MSALQDSHAPAENGKPKRTQLKHIQIDADFFAKPKIVALRYRLGDSGVLFYLALLCDMGRATDGEIDLDCARARGEVYGYDQAKVDEVLEYLLEREMIHKGSKPYLISNSRIQADQESLHDKQEKWRRNKREKSENPGGSRVEVLRNPPGSVNTEDLNTEDLKNEDLKKGGVGENIAPPKPALTDEQKKQISETIAALPLKAIGLDGPKPIKCLKLWAQHVIVNLKKPFEPITAEALVARYSGRGEDFCRDVLESVARGWKGVFPARTGHLTQPPKPPPKGVAGFETPGEVMKKLLAGVK